MGNGSSNSRRNSRVQQTPRSGRNLTPSVYQLSNSGANYYEPNGHLIPYNLQTPMGAPMYHPRYVPNNGQYFMNGGVQAPSAPPSMGCIAEHQKAVTIRNDVNLKRSTLRLEKDEENPGFYLVAFTFDATLPGSICIFFLAKEGANCCFTSLKPGLYNPVQVQFKEGLGQKFRQTPGTGVNLSLFEEADLVNEGPDEVFPLIVRTDTVPRNQPPGAHVKDDDPPGAPLPKWVHSQTTHAVLERNSDEEYHAKVLKQIIWVDGVRYELQEIYGIETNDNGCGFDGSDDGKECVICMCEPRDTTVLPCRHMCMCSNCAKLLRFQTNRCPICRTPVERLLEIKVQVVEETTSQMEDEKSLGSVVGSDESL
eukprot:Gb_05088 [translate_table: standard]